VSDHRRVLITGTGRTGSWWLTHALRGAGVSVTHEHHYTTDRHGPVPDRHIEVSWLAAPYTPPADTHVIHLVRDPVAVIASRAAWGSFERAHPVVNGAYDPRIKGRWAARLVPEIMEGHTAVERAAIHWVRWVGLLHGVTEVLRLEDVTAAEVNRVARLSDYAAGTLTVLPPPSNQSLGVPPRVEWSDVAHIEGLIETAAALGYGP
jgi:hypothetical protein